MQRWSGKTAIVTGASSGIGAAIARELTNNGIKVVGLARRFEKLQELATELGRDKFYPMQCDVRKESDILKAFSWVEKQFGGVDIMVNNAGVAVITWIIESETEEYRKAVDINLIAPTICARESIKSMQKRAVPGHVININSIAGQCAESFHAPIGMYGSTKYGLRALGSELRHEIIHAKLNVKITNISPGAVLTDLFKAYSNTTEYDKLTLLSTKDVADAVIYALGTPPRVEIPEITMIPHNEVMGISRGYLS